MEQFAQPVEGQDDGQEKAPTHGGIQASGCARGAQGNKTISRLSSEHEVHVKLIRAGKRQLPEDGLKVFATNGERKQREQEAQEAELYEQIGRLKMELEWQDSKSQDEKYMCATVSLRNTSFDRFALLSLNADQPLMVTATQLKTPSRS